MSLVELKLPIPQIVTQSQGNHPPQSTVNVFLVFSSAFYRNSPLPPVISHSFDSPSLLSVQKRNTRVNTNSSAKNSSSCIQTSTQELFFIQQLIQHNRIDIQHAYEPVSTSKALRRLQLTTAGILCPERTFQNTPFMVLQTKFANLSVLSRECCVSYLSKRGK